VEVQTRSEENGIVVFPALEMAFDMARNDPTIWKISFNAEDGTRIRLIKQYSGLWAYEPLLELGKIND